MLTDASQSSGGPPGEMVGALPGKGAAHGCADAQASRWLHRSSLQSQCRTLALLALLVAVVRCCCSYKWKLSSDFLRLARTALSEKQSDIMQTCKKLEMPVLTILSLPDQTGTISRREGSGESKYTGVGKTLSSFLYTHLYLLDFDCVYILSIEIYYLLKGRATKWNTSSQQ